MDTVKEGNNLLATYTYNVDNTISTINYNTGINITYGYDRDKNVTSIIQKNPQGGVINNLAYTYDLRGNQLSKDENNETTIYTYDKVNRLKTVEYPTAAVESFTYDNAGNRTQKQLGQDTTTYEYDSRNRLTNSIANDIITTYDYDNNGNLLTETTGTEITSYTYDGFNRTLEVQKPNGSYQANHYDAMGLRVGMTENGVHHEFIFSGGNVIGEINSNTEAFTKYVRGYGLVAMEDPKGNTNYYLNNEHGDVINLVKGTGEILNDYQYDAFGNITSYTEKVANRFKYAGEQFDNITGQYYLRARYYDPEIGRFTQEDTYRGDGLNLYAYVSNNPIRYVDPSGNEKHSKNISKGSFIMSVLGSDGKPIQLAYNGTFDMADGSSQGQHWNQSLIPIGMSEDDINVKADEYVDNLLLRVLLDYNGYFYKSSALGKQISLLQVLNNRLDLFNLSSKINGFKGFKNVRDINDIMTESIKYVSDEMFKSYPSNYMDIITDQIEWTLLKEIRIKANQIKNLGDYMFLIHDNVVRNHFVEELETLLGKYSKINFSFNVFNHEVNNRIFKSRVLTKLDEILTLNVNYNQSLKNLNSLLKDIKKETEEQIQKEIDAQYYDWYKKKTFGYPPYL